MSEPRDLRLERLSDRDGRRSGHRGEIAKVGSSVAGDSSAFEFLTSHATLNNAVFTAPGATEWLRGLRLAVAALLADKEAVPHIPAGACDAIHTSPLVLRT